MITKCSDILSRKKSNCSGPATNHGAADKSQMRAAFIAPDHTFNETTFVRGTNQSSSSVLAWALLVSVGLTLSLNGCKSQEDPNLLRRRNSLSELKVIKQNSKSVPSPLTLTGAIEYSLTHNLDASVAAQEELIRLEAVTGAKRKMLPSLIAGLTRSRRSDYDASKSMTLFGRKRSEEASFSEGKSLFTTNLAAAWSLLDFGMAFYRARQSEDEVLIYKQRARRTKQNLVLQLTEVYWQIQASREALEEAGKLLIEIEKRLPIIRGNIKEGILTRAKGLEMETKLLDTQIQLRNHEKQFLSSRANLDALLGVSIGTPYKLARLNFKNIPSPAELDLQALEREALLMRPELYEKDMQSRITSNEIRSVLTSMFPNASLFARADRDGNDLLYKHNWYTVGVNASFDLFSLPEKLSRVRRLRKEEELSQRKRHAVAIGIIAQVHLAALDYRTTWTEHNLLKQISDKRQALLGERIKERDAGDGDEQQVIEARIDALNASGSLNKSYAALIQCREKLNNTIGRNTHSGVASYEASPVKSVKPESAASNLPKSQQPAVKIGDQDQTKKARVKVLPTASNSPEPKGSSGKAEVLATAVAQGAIESQGQQQ